MLNGSGGYIKINGGDIEIGTSGAASFKASMKELAGGGSASTPGMSFSQSAMQMPKRPLQVSLLNADCSQPTSEPIKLIDGEGIEHNITVASGPSKIEKFKPGFAKGTQPKRRS
jgi:type VI secretion system secreted protein VgrG